MGNACTRGRGAACRNRATWHARHAAVPTRRPSPLRGDAGISIGRAEVSDVADIERLLAENQLPVEGWREHLPTTLVARREGRLIGSAALEPYADGVLLRSVAVAPALHHQGFGHELTNAAIRLAEGLGAPAIH